MMVPLHHLPHGGESGRGLDDAQRHDHQLILPYAISDTFCTFATVEIPALLKVMAG